MNDKEREEFEAWATAKGYISVIGGVKAFAPICHNTYEAWQASAERYQSRIAELEAEVVRLKAEREWQPIETAPKGKIVLVNYQNCLGNGRTVRAKYYLCETLESSDSESGYADEGWYEEAEAYEYLMPLDADPTHWMPLPSQPSEAMKGGSV